MDTVPPIAADPPSVCSQSSVQETAWHWLFEASEDAQLICTREGRILEANRQAQQLLGLSHPALPVKVHLHQFLSRPTATRLAELLRRESKRPQTLSSAALEREGRLRLMADLQISPLEEGLQLVCIKDASRRWRLESHAQRLITAIDATPDIVYLTDAEFRLSFVNPAFQTATGYTIEEVLGRSADFLRAPSEAEKVREYLGAVSQGKDWVGELWNHRSDGSRFPVEASISPIYDRQGGLLGYAAIERDLSVKKKLQEELRLERNFVTSIINSLDSAVYTLDREFRLTHVNDGWKKMPINHGWLRLQEPPQAGHSLLAYVTEQGRAELPLILKNVIATGEPHEMRVADDHGQHWLVNIVPWHNEGEVCGLIYRVTDNTHLTELQNQLYQSQKMETIGALAAGVAHDFNNLLTAVRGNVALLMMDKQLESRITQRLQRIDQAAARAAEITRQLLSFSRASEEQITVLDFNPVIEEAAELARRNLKGCVTLNLEPAATPVRVRMDGTRAQQALLNLCVNAQDAMPNGGQLTLHNSLTTLTPKQAVKARRPEGTRFVRCSVTDTGSGIAPEVLERIFEPFFTTKEKGKGTGLGLSIVQSVISQAGGFQEVESQVGQGTTFHLFLPEAPNTVTANPTAITPGMKRGSGRILVVDDLDFVLDLARSFLGQVGYEVLVANSAEAALELLTKSQGNVRLVLTDYSMPGMNGRQLIRSAAARWPHLRFVLASGYLDESERKAILTEHGTRLLHKPFDLCEAANLIDEVLSAKPWPDAARTEPAPGLGPTFQA